jgi:hypothetical protein
MSPESIFFTDGLNIYHNFNETGRCQSFASSKTFEIGYDDNGNNMLTNKIDGRFTISDLEVWEITG